MQSKRELLRYLAPHLRKYGGRTVVFRGEKVEYTSQSKGSTFWSASTSAAVVYCAGGYGWFTTAAFYIGTYVYFQNRTSDAFCEFVNGLAEIAIKAGCELPCTTVDEWVSGHEGRTSWPGDFYVYCVDALIEKGVWPVSIRYTILGDDWNRNASTYSAAEVIVHNRVQLLKYKQEGSRFQGRCKVDCWRKKKSSETSEEVKWDGVGWG